jgi:type I restriction enzyme S subunit
LKELPELPEGWRYTRLGNLTNNGFQNGLYKSIDSYGRGTIIVRIDNFYDGKINAWNTLKRLEVSPEELDLYSLEEGDILINRVNSMSHLGKCGLVQKIPEPCVFESNMMRTRISKNLLLPRYVSFYLSSKVGLRELRKNAKQAINQASINQTDVSSIAIPINSLGEQHQIVQQIESRLSVCDHLEQEIAKALQQSEALRQSILKKAFEGRLVPQDPNDEPATELLKRIKLNS